MAEQGFSNGLSVPKLASALRVSERTLFRAFRESTGKGPKEYYLIHKLHLFRSRLLQSRNTPGVILHAAQESGFDHPSRLAATYRKHFGELPSETLARRG